MPRPQLPRFSISLVVTEAQQQALLALADKLHILACPTTESDVVMVALRDLHAMHLPEEKNPFNAE